MSRDHQASSRGLSVKCRIRSGVEYYFRPGKSMYINIWPINSGQRWLFVLLSLLKRSVINGYADLLAWDDHTQELCRCRPTCITHSFPFATFSTPPPPPFSLFPFPLSSLHSLPSLCLSLLDNDSHLSSFSSDRTARRTDADERLSSSIFFLSLSLSLSFLFPLRHFLGPEDW